MTLWLSPDPVNLHDLGSDPNPYAYVHGTPLMAVDPDGRFSVWAAVSVGLAAINPASAAFAAQSVATQAVANGGFGNIQWGTNGVFGAIVVGHVASAVGGGVGSEIGGFAGSLVGSMASSTAGYGTSVGLVYAETGQFTGNEKGLGIAVGEVDPMVRTTGGQG